MNIVIAGGSGLVGSAIIPKLQSKGYSVDVITRYPDQPMPMSNVRYFHWDAEQAWHPAVGAASAVINLTGASMAGGSWTDAYKQEIRDSRVRTTQMLVEAQPRVLLQASAVGIYGDGGEDVLTESSPVGKTFLADVAREWETAASAARGSGGRVCCFRIGPVLSREAGMLQALIKPPMLPFSPYSLGLGGPLGPGTQWVPWIHIDDVVGMFMAAIDDDNWTGPVNTVAPGCATMKEIAVAIGRELRKPASLKVPAWALKLMLGEFADALLVSQRVSADRAKALGYTFAFPDIASALHDLMR
ncbi:MAG: hypothetical protein RL169_970 [Armatimonadota bacterium]